NKRDFKIIVFDSKTGLPLNGALGKIGKRILRSDKNGQISFPGGAKKTLAYKILFPGYLPIKGKIESLRTKNEVHFFMQKNLSLSERKNRFNSIRDVKKFMAKSLPLKKKEVPSSLRVYKEKRNSKETQKAKVPPRPLTNRGKIKPGEKKLLVPAGVSLKTKKVADEKKEKTGLEIKRDNDIKTQIAVLDIKKDTTSDTFIPQKQKSKTQILKTKLTIEKSKTLKPGKKQPVGAKKLQRSTVSTFDKKKSKKKPRMAKDMRAIYLRELTGQKPVKGVVVFIDGNQAKTDDMGRIFLEKSRKKKVSTLTLISDVYLSQQFFIKRPIPSKGQKLFIQSRPKSPIQAQSLAIFSRVNKKIVPFPMLLFNGNWYSGDKNGIIRLKNISRGFYKGILMANGFIEKEVILSFYEKKGKVPLNFYLELKP
ncbi:hypothetical protein ACFL35_08075, partial [Candidatus Riflebacteria bacterium]